MKTLAFILATLVSVSAFAIENSKLTKRHQEVIKKAVYESCSLHNAIFEEIKSIETPHRIDQGILDYSYVTILKAVNSLDDNTQVNYLLTVESYYSDSYDHNDRDWGIFLVNSVYCELL